MTRPRSPRFFVAVAAGAALVEVISMVLPRAKPVSGQDFAEQYHERFGWPHLDAFFFPLLAAVGLVLLAVVLLAAVVAVRRPAIARPARWVVLVVGLCLVVGAGANVVVPGAGAIEFDVLFGFYLGLAAAIVTASAAFIATVRAGRCGPEGSRNLS